jgi:hypothetical protein
MHLVLHVLIFYYIIGQTNICCHMSVYLYFRFHCTRWILRALPRRPLYQHLISVACILFCRRVHDFVAGSLGLTLGALLGQACLLERMCSTVGQGIFCERYMVGASLHIWTKSRLFRVRKIVHKSEYAQKNAISAGHPHTWAHGKLNAGITTLHLDRRNSIPKLAPCSPHADQTTTARVLYRTNLFHSSSYMNFLFFFHVVLSIQ